MCTNGVIHECILWLKGNFNIRIEKCKFMALENVSFVQFYPPVSPSFFDCLRNARSKRPRDLWNHFASRFCLSMGLQSVKNRWETFHSSNSTVFLTKQPTTIKRRCLGLATCVLFFHSIFQILGARKFENITLENVERLILKLDKSCCCCCCCCCDDND
jgi:hypothetical protein